MTSALRREATFLSGGVTCRAWVYVPDESVRRPVPCIVMAHGLSGTRDASLEPYAERFRPPAFTSCCSTIATSATATASRVSSSPSRSARRLEVCHSVRPHSAGRRRRPHRPVGMLAVGRTRHRRRGARNRIAAVSAQCPMLDGHASARKVRKQVGFGKIARLAAASIYEACAPRSGWHRTMCRSLHRRDSSPPCRRQMRTMD